MLNSDGVAIKLQKWRWLALLSGLVIVLASVSYLVSYQTFIQAEQQRTQDRASHFRSLLVGVLNQHKPLLSVLTEDPGVIGVLSGEPDIKNQLNQRLARYTTTSGLESIYLMDPEGVTRAASNYQHSRNLSFMGKNYAFRPYFKAALAGNEGSYFAVGATTGLPGHFISSPVLGKKGAVIGVLAAKIDAATLSVMWQSSQDLGFITNASGVIILSNNSSWLYQTIEPLSAPQLTLIRAQKQFAGKVLPHFSWQVVDPSMVTVEGKDYLYTPHDIGNSGWVLHLLSDPARAKKNSAFVALVVSVLVLLLLSWALTVRSRVIKNSLAKSEQDRRQLVTMNDNLGAEIKERHRAERRLSLAQKKLLQASRMAALGQLSAAVIHELGQPLAAFKNYLAAAEIDPEGEDMAQLLGNLDAVAMRMQSTTSQLRFFSRPDETKFIPVELNLVVNNAIKLSQAQCADARVDLHWNPDSQMVAQVMGQSLRLEQVVVNLLINAFAAINGGGNVWLSLDLDQDRWLLRVADDGPGFGNQDPEELFEAFYTTKASTNGMGLGLAISAAIINEHQGQIWAQKSIYGGAEFVVTIPSKK
ncbi:MAG: ATP-binding protein [Gammaproteobacteria bacterium]|nr:ATP-binding protein [Gammaproteobacteria bacterium]